MRRTGAAVRRVAVGAVEIAWEEEGRGERPLVLVHGFTGSRRDFAPRAAALARLGRSVRIDLRGHGALTNTGDPKSYTFEQLAEDLIGFLDALGIERCDLLGHSMGGMVALRAVLARPERVASLILMDTAARAPDMDRGLLELAVRIAEEAGLEGLASAMRARARNDPARPEPDRRLEAEWGEGYWRDWRLPNLRDMDPAAYGALGAAIFDQAPLGERVGAIRCPTLVLVGAEDLAFLAPADELEAAIPDARRITIPGAAHQPQLEAPDAWLAAVRAHLARVRSADACSPPTPRTG